MLPGTLTFLLGVVSVQFLPDLPSPVEVGLLAAVTAPLALVWRRHRILTPLLGLSAGFFWAWFHAYATLSDRLPPELEGGDLVVVGTVEGLPLRGEGRNRFVLRSEGLWRNGRRVDFQGRLRLSWYGSRPLSVNPGERWRFTVRLKRPRGLRNPGAFDYERWLFSEGIRATGYVRDRADNRRLDRTGGGGLDGLRDRLGGRIAGALGERPMSGLLVALAVGDRRAITPAQWEVLAATGTTHLMAISGLHIGLVSGLAFGMARLLWAWCASCAARVAAPRAAAVAAGLAALLYAALAGFSVPTQRALVMAAVALAMVALGRSRRPWRPFLLALLLVLVVDPLAVLSAGFWLSFAAVAVLIYGLSRRIGAGRAWRQWLRVQWLVTLGLFPLLLLIFDQASLVSPAANLLAVPWVGLVVVPATLSGATLLWLWPDAASVMLCVGEWAMWLCWQLLAPLAAAARFDGTVPLWGLLPAVAGIAWMMAPRGWPLRWLGLLGLLPALLYRPAAPAAGEARITLLDVGQGLAAVVETNAHVLVYDTGPRFSGRFDAGSAVLVPYLRHRAIGAVDTLVLSHGDNDHVGGREALMGAYPVGRVLSTVSGKGIEPCTAGQSWQWDGVDFAILHPGEADARGNDGSCVLRVEAAGQRLLLAGDIEAAGEAELVAREGASLRADVLVAPHHGSTTSSTSAFVVATAPRRVLFATGYRNRYGFPDEGVVARYRDAGAEPVTTAEAGAITVVLGRGEVTLERFRRMARRYWHSLP